MKKIFKFKKQSGFTLIEVIIVVAVLSALTASAIYALSPGDKISAAEETGLKQILLSRVPTELVQHRLKNGDLSSFKFSGDNIAFMGAWPGVKTTNKLKFTAAAQKLTLEMETTFDANSLASTLNVMQNITAGVETKVLKVAYTVQ